MSTRSEKVETFGVDYLCDRKGCDGVMRPTGMVLTGNPPKYTHACTACGDRHAFEVTYPYFAHEPAREKQS